MAENNDLERTEEPSARRLQEAQARGQVPRSQELLTFSILAAGFGGVIVFSRSILEHLEQLFIRNLHFGRSLLYDIQLLPELLKRALQEILIAVSPVLLLTLVGPILAAIALNGWHFSVQALEPNFKRINPLNGIKRIISLRSLIELIKALLKSLLIGGIAVIVMWYQKEHIFHVLSMSAFENLAYCWDIIRFTILIIVTALLVLVAIDVPYQLWDYRRSLRMTKEEVKQESKETEGSPEMRAKIRQLQTQAARRRMMAAVPKADVIVTNPTHFAVALSYNRNMRAPIVAAKGSYLLAERIIDIAQKHRVPIVRMPALARALYRHSELGQEIPGTLYSAVAEILAYIYQLKHYQQYGGSKPNVPTNINVPESLDPGEYAPISE